MKVSVARWLIFRCPLLAIINNKQVEYISSSHLQSDWMVTLGVGGGGVLQYAERRVAELEMGCAGGIHYQGRQLHLEIVAAISTSHLSRCERGRSYSERPGSHPHVFLRSQLHTCEIPLKEEVL